MSLELEKSQVERVLPVVLEPVRGAGVLAFEATVTVVTTDGNRHRFRYLSTPEITRDGARVSSYPRSIENPACEDGLEHEIVGLIVAEFIARGLPFTDYRSTPVEGICNETSTAG